jgi:PAS domain S-box-containing protein
VLPNEKERLSVLLALQLQGEPADPVLDALVRTAAQALGCSAAAISFVDDQRRWFKASLGFTRLEMPRELSICAHTLAHGGLLEIADVRADARFADNPLVAASELVRFYAGMPIGLDGQALGTLCVVDGTPRELSAAQRAVLADLARVAEHWLQSRREHLALQEREREYRLLAEQMPAIVYRVALGRTPVLVYMSPALKAFGHATDAWMARPDAWWQAVHADDRTRVHERLQHALTVQTPVELEYRVSDAQGRWRHVHDSVRSAGLDESGMPIVQGAMFDLTERRREHEWMRMVSVVVEQASEAVVITDAQGLIEYVNDAALRRWDYRRSELVGQPVAVLRGGALSDATCRDMLSRVHAGKRWRGPVNSHRKDGSLRIEVATVIPVCDANQQVTHALAISEDVTDKRKLRDELARYRDRMESLVVERTAALEKTKAAAVAASQAKSDFLATISHEIRTPMTGVIGAAELLERSVLTPYQHTLASTVRESAGALLSMIDGVLDFSKIEAGHLAIEHEPLNLRQLLESTCDALQPLATARGVHLHLFVNPLLPEHILGDAVRLRQIVTNLVGNAIKFSAGGARPGRVSVRAQPGVAQTLRISVADNGIGLSAHAQLRLFQPFVQADRGTSRKYGGSGLGLAICHRLALAMQGQIGVTSALGEGACFHVDLPLRAHAAHVADAGDAPPPSADLSGVDCHLVVSDQEWAGDWRAYLVCAGARVLVWGEMPHADVFAGNGRDVVLVVQAELLQRGPMPGNTPAVPRVELHHGRRRQPREELGQHVVLDIEGMHRDALLHAVLMAAQRLPLTGSTIARRSSPATGAAPTAADAAARGQLVLVAEDNAISRLIIEHQLAALGFAAEFAVDGDHALALWREGRARYGLLITDLQMPGMDGWQLSRAIRSEEHASRRIPIPSPIPIPIVGFTASALADEVQRCKQAGMNDVLSKPLHIDELGAVIQHWMLRGAGTAASAEQVAMWRRSQHGVLHVVARHAVSTTQAGAL